MCLTSEIDSNFVSFQRQLNLYGFRRTKGTGKGAYHHSNFLAGERKLASEIRSVSNVAKAHANTEEIPEPRIASPLGSSQSSPDGSVSFGSVSTELTGPTCQLQTTPQCNAFFDKQLKSPICNRSEIFGQQSDKPSKKKSMSKQSPQVQRADLLSLDLEPKHDYGTRRKKQFEINVKRKKQDIDSEEQGDQELQSFDVCPRPSSSSGSEDCDLVIDMTTSPHQRRKLTTQLILINMTPTMNRRSAVVTELHLET
jgi:hypothetical protein